MWERGLGRRVDVPREIWAYADSLSSLQRFEEAKSLLRKVMPVARRVLGEGNETSIRMRLCYAKALVLDEYLERKSVDAVLRQEREKETEETDPFL